MRGNSQSFRVGRVQVYRRGQVWYLCYHEDGQRRRPRVGPDKAAARQLAHEINSQLEAGAPSQLGFEPISLTELQTRWLAHHEQVRRSSVHTIRRYRAATSHLIEFAAGADVPRTTARFRTAHAEQFVVHLRTILVSPNGHKNSAKRPLLDKGVRYILETCRSMFAFAAKRRHLAPYAENPFTELELDRMPIEHVRPIDVFTPEQVRKFLLACDDWQLPIFLTLMLTGMRPGELTHLLLPDDLDLVSGVIRIKNKPRLGWQVKTRNEREIPLIGPLVDVLRIVVGSRQSGPVFRRSQIAAGAAARLDGVASTLEHELESRIAEQECSSACRLSRSMRLAVARGVWRDMGAIKTDRIRIEFIRLCRRIGQPRQTAPKLLRHLFATTLQDANVDPLVRNELMGHAPAATGGNGFSLGMTTQYTHTRPETKRKQLEMALLASPAVEIARNWANERR